MNPWDTFTKKPVFQKDPVSPFKVSDYKCRQTQPRPTIKTSALKDFSASNPQSPSSPKSPLSRKRGKPVDEEPKTCPWYLDQCVTKHAASSSLYERMGGGAGVKSLHDDIMEETRYEHSLMENDSNCLDGLDLEKTHRYLAYLLGLSTPETEKACLELTLQLKESLHENPTAPWEARANGLQECLSIALKRREVKGVTLMELRLLAVFLRKKFLSPPTLQKRRYQCHILVPWVDKFLPIPSVVDKAGENAMREAAKSAEGALYNCLDGAKYEVHKMWRKGITKLSVAVDIIPRFFEYIEILKTIDMKKQTQFLDALRVASENELRYLMEAEEAKRKENARAEQLELELELQAELDAEERVEVQTEVKAEKLFQPVHAYRAQEAAEPPSPSPSRVASAHAAALDYVCQLLSMDLHSYGSGPNYYDGGSNAYGSTAVYSDGKSDEYPPLYGTEAMKENPIQPRPENIVVDEEPYFYQEEEALERYKLTPEEELEVRAHNLGVDIEAARRGMLRVVMEVPLSSRTEMTNCVMDEEYR